MKITLNTTNLTEARKDKALMKVLYALTLRGTSEMRNLLNRVSRDEYWSNGYQIILAKHKNKVVGWSLIFPYAHIDYRDWPSFKRANNYKAYFYVGVKYRRAGVGSALLEEAQKIIKSKKKRMLVDPHDETSFGFFYFKGVIR